MSVARKLFRLFKSFNEWVTIKGYLKGDAPWDNWLPIISRVAFLFYWFFDNLVVLIKVKFIQSMDLKSVSRKASKCWLTGIWLCMIIGLLGLAKTAKEEAQILIQRSKAKAKVGASETFDEKQFRDELKKISAARKTHILNIIKMIGDGIAASQSLGYPQRFLGVNFNDTVVGVGGFTSAFITCYQKYPK